jgi:hypothetical protein
MVAMKVIVKENYEELSKAAAENAAEYYIEYRKEILFGCRLPD